MALSVRCRMAFYNEAKPVFMPASLNPTFHRGKHELPRRHLPDGAVHNGIRQFP
eukprot:CAMPEP_0168470696 /NCGR_PEP_ID=MMETSP0228-20121227/58869_1 /TAXON_ID=133427 /ORGANISM="Protoceratium reticulatum, Strain CCCM 535 (=CCMP 1889)" /LENGTH=53 /DNA_ID=CAMNT_0008486521 /DNA_START=45 /DNA_END=203 /DNA_ORIENTATION=-